MRAFEVTMDEPFAEYLRRRLREKDWNQARLADESNLSRGTISYLLSRPERKPDMETIRAIASAFGESVSRWLDAAGLPVDTMPSSRLSPEEEQVIQSLSPEQRALLLQLARQMRDRG
jgi:transcriptional regulator with XRE-family HTH domain